MKKLFLLDGMALVYRAHFALIARPIFTSTGINTSALFGFTQTLLDIIGKQQPTHIGVAFDTQAPTGRHAEFPDYKATRQAMPEDLSRALPSVRRMLEAFRIPAISRDGYEADDLIGTLVCRAAKQQFTSFMVTSDKDFGQLVSDNVFIYKPGRMGGEPEILGVPEVCARWGISRPEQVVDVLALMGDSSDNIPGVPGIGEKTAIKLIGQYGSVERLFENLDSLSGRVRDTLETNAEQARLSKRLATVNCSAPCDVDLESLEWKGRDDERLRDLLIEFEFNFLGRRLFGDNFKAGRGSHQSHEQTPVVSQSAPAKTGVATTVEFDFGGDTAPPHGDAGASPVSKTPAPPNALPVLARSYITVTKPEERAALIGDILQDGMVALSLVCTPGNTREARPVGLAFALRPGAASFVPLPAECTARSNILKEFAPVFESAAITKLGHNLKFDVSVLRWNGVVVSGKLLDLVVAHSLAEPDMRHSIEYLSEVFLGRTPASMASLVGVPQSQTVDPAGVPVEKLEVYACERADIALQLWKPVEKLLKERSQERVFNEIECPLLPVLVDMEYAGVKVDSVTLADFGARLGKEIDELEKTICRIAGTTFNLNSPKQLGQILFDVLKISDAPKKTRTGQYSTDEQTLAALATDHPIVQKLLEHRAASKLKSTYADALPAAIWPPTGRIHTTFSQAATSTGRLNSQDPNLQNIPIRTERGQEIRKAFIPGVPGFLLLSADYSQIELRIIAALSKEHGLLEAFRTGVDVHTATAAKVYGVSLDSVTPEMRRKAKMVNYGIAYGISAFGLAQRLNIPKREGGEIIDQYFRQFPGIRGYMDGTIEFARRNGYVETVTGRRRYIRDINSKNNNVRGAAERNAINAPVQGTAADMIKIAMINIQNAFQAQKLESRMLLQVHDELVFELEPSEEADVRAIVSGKMTTAIPLDVPMVVDVGVGNNWLEAH